MKPVLLLIPGMLNTASVWREVASGLASVAEARIAHVQDQTSIAQMADDALAQVADVPADRPVCLVGFSMGGYVAIELLARSPQRWACAALVATSCLPETPEGAAGREKAIEAFEADFESTIHGVAKRSLGQPSPELRARLVDMMREVGAATAIRQTRAIRGRADHRAALASLSVPVWVVCGQLDRITPPAWSQALADAIPGARLQWVEDAGHMLPIEQPSVLIATLQQALHPHAFPN